MSMPRPSEEDIETRAREISAEAEAYPEDTRARLLAIKKAALGELVERFEDNMDVIAGHYPGWTREDLKTLLRKLP